MWQLFVKLLLTVLLVIDPIGIIPQYMSITAAMSEREKRAVVKKAVCIAGLVLLVFIVFGRTLLQFFGITPGAFYISGGILFFLIAFEMIYNKPGSRAMPQDDKTDRPDVRMAALFPLAVPFLAGPGLITTIMIYVNTPSIPWTTAVLMLLGAVAIGLCAVYIALRAASMLVRLIGVTGMFVLEKIMGLILSGLSVQLIYNGLVKLNIIGGM